MSADDPMAWWYGRIDFERRVPQPGELKLDQMRALLRALGDPDRRVRIIHIAGSKGKGSTAAMISAILQGAGYRVGLFTSPHLSHVEERIQVDGEPITRLELLSQLGAIRDAVSPAINPTFFEVATAAGFSHFVRRRVDVAVVEVGLGGRFDSTNVCRPMLSVITSISFDHMQYLGDTLAKIAFEKAGIIKPNTPAISGVAAPDAAEVIERVASERRSPLARLGHEFSFDYQPGHVERDLPKVTVRTRRREWPSLELGLLGAHQAANAALAVAAIEELVSQGLHVAERHVRQGLANVRWPARLEIVRRRPWVILDCAHNTASAQALVDTLAESFPRTRRTLILAASADKDVPGMLRILAPHFERVLLTRYGQNQRGAAPEQMAAWLKEICDVPHEIYSQAGEAWAAARSQATSDEMIVVTGSVFLAGELRPVMIERLILP